MECPLKDLNERCLWKSNLPIELTNSHESKGPMTRVSWTAERDSECEYLFI